MAMAFSERLQCAADQTDAVLAATIANLRCDGRSPQRLLEATEHALLGGGKRFRPFLVIECASLCGAGAPDGAEGVEGAAQVGAAFECLHAYSLVHDDLPAMDDDDLRRGRPTVHKAYDEATAILVGDGLQALAFELISSEPVPAQAQGRLARCLAAASGFAGMVGGQYRDLNALGLGEDGVKLMQSMKTGALIRASCAAGATVAGADQDKVARLEAFGALLGEAFQLADDLLDLEGTVEEVGKRVGKDHEEGKATIPQLIGAEGARRKLKKLVEAAAECLEPFGERAAVLREACHFVAKRRS
ncbi:MAG: polyprenyl synthetase family protein [Pseudomonadota bacterium]